MGFLDKKEKKKKQPRDPFENFFGDEFMSSFPKIMGKMIIYQEYNKLFLLLKTRVTASKYRAAAKVNNELINLYHHIGNIILEAQEKEGWGAKIIDEVINE